jgi:hypothetical protein
MPSGSSWYVVSSIKMRRPITVHSECTPLSVLQAQTADQQAKHVHVSRAAAGTVLMRRPITPCTASAHPCQSCRHWHHHQRAREFSAHVACKWVKPFESNARHQDAKANHSAQRVHTLVSPAGTGSSINRAVVSELLTCTCCPKPLRTKSLQMPCKQADAAVLGLDCLLAWCLRHTHLLLRVHTC